MSGVADELDGNRLTGARDGASHPHLQAIERRRPTLGFLEVHPENYFCHPIALARLEALRNHYPLSLHAVGLSLGCACELDVDHLGKLADLVNVSFS